jgi:hypothetical protein
MPLLWKGLLVLGIQLVLGLLVPGKIISTNAPSIRLRSSLSVLHPSLLLSALSLFFSIVFFSFLPFHIHTSMNQYSTTHFSYK